MSKLQSAYLRSASERTDVGGGVHGVAHLELLHRAHELGHELVVDLRRHQGEDKPTGPWYKVSEAYLLLHVDALNRAARLTRVVVGAISQRLGGSLPPGMISMGLYANEALRRTFTFTSSQT